MPSWEKYIAREEEKADYKCKIHSYGFGITDPETYMDIHGIVSCEDMPCFIDCPFIPKIKSSRSISKRESPYPVRYEDLSKGTKPVLKEKTTVVRVTSTGRVVPAAKYNTYNTRKRKKVTK